MDLNKCRKEAVEALGITDDIYNELIQDLLKDAHGTLKELQEAFDKDDFTALLIAAHSLKGYVANLRIEEMENIAGTIERICRESKDKKVIERNIAVLRKSFEELKKSV